MKGYPLAGLYAFNKGFEVFYRLSKEAKLTISITTSKASYF
jgi:hypothetical protein